MKTEKEDERNDPPPPQIGGLGANLVGAMICGGFLGCNILKDYNKGTKDKLMTSNGFLTISKIMMIIRARR